MNKFLLILPFLFVHSISSFGQRAIDIKYEQDAKGNYVFSCYNNSYCTYILDIGFTTFTNLKADRSLPFHEEIKPGYTKLFTLSAVDPQLPVQLKYSSGFQKGCMHPNVNKDFTYILPISPGKDAQVYEMSPDKSGDSAFWYVIRLKMKPGDTIYAARKGIVNEVSDGSGVNDAGQASIGTENYIEIAQPDCSFARYGILKKSSSFVKRGQAVNPGQPIGIVGGDSYGRGSDLRFSVYYYQEEEQSGDSRITHYIITQIWTKKNGKGKLKHGAVYISEWPAAVLNQETTVKKKGAKR